MNVSCKRYLVFTNRNPSLYCTRAASDSRVISSLPHRVATTQSPFASVSPSMCSGCALSCYCCCVCVKINDAGVYFNCRCPSSTLQPSLVSPMWDCNITGAVVHQCTRRDSPLRGVRNDNDNGYSDGRWVN